MSWLSPKHLEDASRILRGVGLVLARAAIDSAAQRTALAQAQAAAVAAANAAARQAQQWQAHAGAEQQLALSSQAGVTPLVAYLYPHTVALLAAADVRAWQPTPVSWQAATQAGAPAHEPQQQQQQQQHQQQQQQQQPQQSVQVEQQQPPVSMQVEQLSVQQQHLQQTQQQQPLERLQQQPVEQPKLPQQQQQPQPVVQQAALQAEGHAASHAPAAQTAHAFTANQQQQSPMQEAAKTTAAADAAAAAPAEPAASSHTPAAAAAGSPVSRPGVDSWMSGHESPTTEAEAVLPAAAVTAQSDGTQQPVQQQPPQQQLKVLRERRVPSTQLGRALGFAGMGASLLLGSITDSVTRTLGGSGSTDSGSSSSGSSSSGGGVYSSFITESNAERLAAALCRMRGAALKIGQMLSIQDETVLPPQIQSALERVRAGADVMPRSQLEGQLVAELGQDWSTRLASFDWTPRAAASIGQVHAAVLPDGTQVAMKVQYPGVARSIESDVDNLMRLIRIANILPKGLYVENAVKVAKRELALECNYTYEAAAQQRFRELVAADSQLAGLFYVPRVYPQLSSRQVLTTEWVNGITIDKVAELPQDVRDHVGTCLLRLTLRELYEWRFMQTDPNWGNFLYDQASGRLNLIDFGAAKQYPRRFVDKYLQMVHACAERDKQRVVDMSVALGFLTGDESAVMLDAHTEAGFVVGLPFATQGIYDFGAHSGMTPRVAELGSIMLKHRLTPPPEESYSLHRKLSGAFLACMKLRARVPCRELFFSTFDNYSFDAQDAADSSCEDHQEVPHAHTAAA